MMRIIKEIATLIVESARLRAEGKEATHYFWMQDVRGLEDFGYCDAQPLIDEDLHRGLWVQYTAPAAVYFSMAVIHGPEAGRMAVKTWAEDNYIDEFEDEEEEDEDDWDYAMSLYRYEMGLPPSDAEPTDANPRGGPDYRGPEL